MSWVGQVLVFFSRFKNQNEFVFTFTNIVIRRFVSSLLGGFFIDGHLGFLPNTLHLYSWIFFLLFPYAFVLGMLINKHCVSQYLFREMFNSLFLSFFVQVC